MKKRVGSAILACIVSVFVLQPSYAHISADKQMVSLGEPFSNFAMFADSYYKHVKTVLIRDQADEHVFDDDSIFPELEDVLLDAPGSNAANLIALAAKRPHLRCLSIRQSEQLSDACVRALSQFKDLKQLEIACPVSNPLLLASILPKSLEQFQIRGSNLVNEVSQKLSGEFARVVNSDNHMQLQLHVSNGSNEESALIVLPNLRSLTLENVALTSNFLRSLYCPNLRSISLYAVKLDPGVAAFLEQFKLNELILIGSKSPAQDRVILRRLHAEIDFSRDCICD